MLPSKVFVVAVVLCATMKGGDGASSPCKNAPRKGGETQECHGECLMKYDYISYDDIPTNNVPVCKGWCKFGSCWCYLNPSLRIPNSPTKLQKLAFYSSAKASDAHYYRMNFGTEASKARGKKMTPQALAKRFSRGTSRKNSATGSVKGSDKGSNRGAA